MSRHVLIRAILHLSHSRDWERAKSEWSLQDVFRQVHPQACLCGHRPVFEICILRNHVTGSTVEVGNSCVQKFLGIPSHLIFDGLDRVRDDLDRALNEAVIEHARVKGWVTEWERQFLLDTARKRRLTGPQAQTRQRINRKVLAQVERTGPARPTPTSNRPVRQTPEAASPVPVPVPRGLGFFARRRLGNSGPPS